MNILFYTSFPPPVTGQTICNKINYELISENRLNFTVKKISTSNFKKLYEARKWHAIILACKNYFKLIKALLSNKIDILYLVFSSNKSGLLRDVFTVSLIKLFSNAKIICHLHSGNYGLNFKSGIWSFLYTRIRYNTDCFIFLGNSVIHEKQLYKKNKIFVRSNTVGKEFIIEEDKLRIEIVSRSKSTLSILFVSNLIPEKGLYCLLEAIPELLKKNTNIYLNIIGDGNDNEKSNLEDKIKSLGIHKYVKYWGKVTERSILKTHYLKSDVLVLPSYYAIEAQPMCLLETLNFGVPIIGTKHATIPDIIENEYNGFLVNKHSHSQIADCLLKISVPSVKEKMAFNARESYLRKFNPEILNTQFIKIFEEVIL